MRRARIIAAAAAAGLAGGIGLHVSGSSPPRIASSPFVHSGSRGSSSVTSPTRPSSVPSPSGVHSATGAIEQYGYGQLAVRVTVSGAKIIGLSTTGLTTAEPYSAQIAAQVIPMLKAEVLAADAPQVNGISGATYTTEAYLYSIQSALDRLHVK